MMGFFAPCLAARAFNVAGDADDTVYLIEPVDRHEWQPPADEQLPQPSAPETEQTAGQS